MLVNIMGKFVKEISKIADLLAKLICIPTALIFVIIIISQVFFRYVFKMPLDWYLEVVQISYMWALFMSITIAFKSGKHIQFSFLFDKFHRKLKSIILITIYILSLCFFVFIAYYGLKSFSFSKVYSLPTLGISRQWMILPIPISAVILIIHNLDLLFATTIDILNKREDKQNYFRIKR